MLSNIHTIKRNNNVAKMVSMFFFLKNIQYFLRELLWVSRTSGKRFYLRKRSKVIWRKE